MTESSCEALAEQLSKAHDEARQAKADLAESTKRIAILESQGPIVDKDMQIHSLQGQIEELKEMLKKAEESLLCSSIPTDPEAGSPKTQSDDDYVVVEQEGTDILQNKLKEREVEIKKASAHAKRFEEMYTAAEDKTLKFEKQVKVLEISICEKIDDANALLEKVKELEELLTAGQIQIAALEEKSKSSDEAQKKVEYEKVLFLETEDQLVKNFKKAHDEVEQYRNMISQLEMSVKIAEEKAANLEKCMEDASQRNQELESKIADLNIQNQSIARERSFHQSSSINSDNQLSELESALKVYRDKADSYESTLSQLEQELQMYRGREKKVEDDVRSVEEKIVVHEATSRYLVDNLEGGRNDNPFVEGHASSPDLEQELEMLPGRSNIIDEEMKALGENVVAHVNHSKLLMTEFWKIQSAHILYACEAEVSKSQLETHAKDLEERVSQLEQDIIASRRREERMRQERQISEQETSLLEKAQPGLVGPVEEKNDSWSSLVKEFEINEDKVEELVAYVRREKELKEELISVKEDIAVFESEKCKWIADCVTLRDAESRIAFLESQANDLQESKATKDMCDMCSQMDAHVKDRDLKLNELDQELQVSKEREEDLQYQLKCLEEKVASHEQIVTKYIEEAKVKSVAHDRKVQELEAQNRGLREDIMEAKTSAREKQSWTQQAAFVLRVHAESLDELRVKFLDVEHRLSTANILSRKEEEALQRTVNDFHLKLKDMQLPDKFEDLTLCCDLLSLERDSLDFQMVSMARQNATLESQVESLKSQLQNLESEREQKKTFREVTLDGELQTLRVQVAELLSLRARLSELSSLQLRLTQMQDSLRAAEARELEQNLVLAKEQQKVAAAGEEICALKSNLLNQAQISDIMEQNKLLEQKLMIAEADNKSRREEIDAYRECNTNVQDKVNEVVLEQASDLCPPAELSPHRSKRKARKRKSGKTGKASVSQELVQTADMAHSSRSRIALYLLPVVLVAIMIRFGLG